MCYWNLIVPTLRGFKVYVCTGNIACTGRWKSQSWELCWCAPGNIVYAVQMEHRYLTKDSVFCNSLRLCLLAILLKISQTYVFAAGVPNKPSAKLIYSTYSSEMDFICQQGKRLVLLLGGLLQTAADTPRFHVYFWSIAFSLNCLSANASSKV